MGFGFRVSGLTLLDLGALKCPRPAEKLSTEQFLRGGARSGQGFRVERKGCRQVSWVELLAGFGFVFIEYGLEIDMHDGNA